VKKPFFLLAVPFLFANGFFVAKMTAYPELARWANRPEIPIVSALFVLLFAWPSFAATVRWLGARQGAMLLIALGVFALAIESFAVITGVPYGRFSYGEKIGVKLFDVVPWTVPFAWSPVLLAAFFLARKFLFKSPHEYSCRGRDRWIIVAATSAIALVFDLVLDPGAVAQGFWKYQNGGFFYGVPLSNFVGWLVSGTAGTMIILRFIRREKSEPPGAMLGSAWLIIVFWTSVCAWSQLWIPTLVGLILLGVIAPIFFANK
jgi:putative membrane protein